MLEVVMILINVVGFGLAILQVRQGVDAARKAEEAAKLAQSASQRAETAANNVRGTFVLGTTIADCAVALGMMDQLKILQREGNWKAVPELCSNLKRRLSSIRTQNDSLSEHEVTELQLAIGQFGSLEDVAERHLWSGESPKPQNVPRLNSIVSEQIDRVHLILTRMQRSIRKQDHGGE